MCGVHVATNVYPRIYIMYSIMNDTWYDRVEPTTYLDRFDLNTHSHTHKHSYNTLAVFDSIHAAIDDRPANNCPTFE